MNTNTTFRHHHHAHPYHLTILLIILTGFLFLLTSCSSGGLVEVVPQEEQTVFTAQDTLDIMALATEVHPGTITEIVIVTVPKRLTTSSVSANCNIIAFFNHVTVRFAPTLIGEQTKRYYTLELSNITWDESESYRDDSGYRTRSNWITSDSRLYSYDKTVFALDSCTIEATVYDADNAIVTQLLNLISTSTYSVDSSVQLSEPQFNPLSEPLDLTEITEITGYDYATTSLINITCNNSTTYTFLFENGAATIKGVAIRYQTKFFMTSL